LYFGGGGEKYEGCPLVLPREGLPGGSLFYPGERGILWYSSRIAPTYEE
jgi:hypothetical protein